jgi:pyruvate dehydrogenase E2 component (dihydrolipoyllysine-residue acetyltransferase)
MATNVILPALGMAQDSGKIMEWLKAEGDQVTKGEPLVVVETDKAAVDLEAPASGTLAQVRAAAGDVVPVAAVIAVILAPGEVGPSTTVSAAHASAPSTAAPAALVHSPAAPATATHPGRRAASPKARRIAAAHGVDISALLGSGPGGVVLAADVLGAATGAPPTNGRANGTAPAAASTTAALEAKPAAPASTDGGAALSLSGTWRLMAERTTQSWTTVPHFVLVREVHAAQLISWRERVVRQGTAQVTYSDLLVRVVAEALRHHPQVNASWEGGAIRTHDAVNVGLAVATADGLVVPVIQHADELSLRGIARQRADLVARAQTGRLRLPDVQGGTFTVSNLGMYGVDAFTAIVNAPQAAILAVGRIVERVVPVEGQPAVRPMITLSLSCDHRVIDGARGAQFLAHVARLLEDPTDLAN